MIFLSHDDDDDDDDEKFKKWFEIPSSNLEAWVHSFFDEYLWDASNELHIPTKNDLVCETRKAFSFLIETKLNIKLPH